MLQSVTKINNIIIDEIGFEEINQVTHEDLDCQFNSKNLVAFWGQQHGKTHISPIIGSVSEDGAFIAKLICNAGGEWNKADSIGKHQIMDGILFIESVITESDSDNEDNLRINCQLLRKKFLADPPNQKNKKKAKENAKENAEENSKENSKESEKDKQKPSTTGKSKLPCPEISHTSSSGLSLPSNEPMNSTGINPSIPTFEISTQPGMTLCPETHNDILHISSRKWYFTKKFPMAFRNCIIDEEIHFDNQSFGKNPIWLDFKPRSDLERDFGIKKPNDDLKQQKKTRDDRFRDENIDSTPTIDKSRSKSLKFNFTDYDYLLTQMPQSLDDALYKESSDTAAAEFLYEQFLDKGKFDNSKPKDENMKTIQTEVKWCYRYLEILQKKKHHHVSFFDEQYEPTGKLSNNLQKCK